MVAPEPEPRRDVPDPADDEREEEEDTDVWSGSPRVAERDAGELSMEERLDDDIKGDSGPAESMIVRMIGIGDSDSWDLRGCALKGIGAAYMRERRSRYHRGCCCTTVSGYLCLPGYAVSLLRNPPIDRHTHPARRKGLLQKIFLFD